MKQAEHCKEWEQFELCGSHGHYGLKSAHGTYISALDNGGVTLIDHLKGWEEFKIHEVLPSSVKSGDKVAIKTSHGTFLSAWDDGSLKQQSHIKEWEQWVIEKTDDGHFSIKSAHNKS